MKNLRLILVCILVSVAGFQTSQPVQAAAIDNGSFMSLWSSYSHCQATTDIDQLREDALTLTNAANRSLTQEGFVLPQTILSYQPQSEYAYYTLQAKALLSELETNVVQVTLNLP